MTTITTSKWVRVTMHNRCPVCDKPDWCLISEGGKAAICARIESDRPAGSKGTGWIHTLDNSMPLPEPKPTLDAKQTPKTAPDVLDMAYRALLQELSLSGTHRENLQRRGLTDAQIDGLGYRTLPTYGRYDIANRLQAKGVKLAGVPGFYLEAGAGRWRLTGPAGISIPAKDTRSRIVGIQIRRDHAEGGKSECTRRFENCIERLTVLTL